MNANVYYSTADVVTLCDSNVTRVKEIAQLIAETITCFGKKVGPAWQFNHDEVYCIKFVIENTRHKKLSPEEAVNKALWLFFHIDRDRRPMKMS